MSDPWASYSADALALHAVDTDDGDGLYSVRVSGGARVMAMAVECPICGVQPDAMCMDRSGRTFGPDYVHECRAEAAPQQCPHYWGVRYARCLLPVGHTPVADHKWPPECGAHNEVPPAYREPAT